MFNVRLAGDHLNGKWLFTWLSLEMSLMVPNFVLSWMRFGTELSHLLRIFLSAFELNSAIKFTVRFFL